MASPFRPNAGKSSGEADAFGTPRRPISAHADADGPREVPRLARRGSPGFAADPAGSDEEPSYRHVLAMLDAHKAERLRRARTSPEAHDGRLAEIDDAIEAERTWRSLGAAEAQPQVSDRREQLRFGRMALPLAGVVALLMGVSAVSALIIEPRSEAPAADAAQAVREDASTLAISIPAQEQVQAAPGGDRSEPESTIGAASVPLETGIGEPMAHDSAVPDKAVEFPLARSWDSVAANSGMNSELGQELAAAAALRSEATPELAQDATVAVDTARSDAPPAQAMPAEPEPVEPEMTAEPEAPAADPGWQMAAVDPQAQSGSAAPAAQEPAKPARSARTTSPVNMRAGPDNGKAVLAVVPGKTLVDVVSCNPWWCQVDFGGRRGWISKGFIDSSAIAGL